MRWMRLTLPMLCLIALTGWPEALRATDAADLCTGDPCIITGTNPIENFSDLDFGTAAVQLQGILDVGTGTMSITAGSFTITATGRILAEGSSTAETGGSVDITTTGDIQILGTNGTGAIAMRGCGGGDLELTSTAGNVIATGRINLQRLIGCSLTGDGGTLTIFDAGQVTLARVDAIGGSQAGGGFVDIVARGAVDLANINLSGGDFDAGALFVTADGAVTLNGITANSSGLVGVGGEVDVLSEGPILVNGSIDLLGGNGVLEGDDGGFLTLTAGIPGARHDLTINGQIRANGRGLDGFGGSITLEGERIFVNQPLEARGGSIEAGAGSIEAFAVSQLVTTASITASTGGLGLILLASDGDLETQALVDASGPNGTDGGDVTLTARKALRVGADVRANGGLGGLASGGIIVLRGCTVDVPSGVSLDASQEGGTIRSFSGQQMTLAGSFTAGPSFGLIELRHRRPGVPPITTGATFNISPVVLVDATIRPCAICTVTGDADGDGIDDSCDACTNVFDPSQLDTDRDGFGNACDCDFNQSGSCDIADFNVFLPDFQTGVDGGTGTDMDGSGAVGIGDFNLFLPGFSSGFPGPSAQAP